jgi:hypothetical protein
MDRRDFLKYFGIGSTVVPLIGGMPKTDTIAKLIEEPKADVKIVPQMPPEEFLDLLNLRQRLDMHVSFSHPKGGRVTFRAETFVSKYSIGTKDGFNFDKEFVPMFPSFVSWTLEGSLAGPPQAFRT